jgi:CheY-like chemotaxis protein
MAARRCADARRRLAAAKRPSRTWDTPAGPHRAPSGILSRLAFRGKSDVSEANSKGNRVLVAEDYPDISQLVGDILKDEGYQVIGVSRGADVIPTVLRCRPDLILLDLSLPDIPGNEVLQQLSANPQTCEIPVIIVSAYTDQLRRVPQVVSVVNKPFDLTTLVDAVQEARQTRHRAA